MAWRCKGCLAVYFSMISTGKKQRAVSKQDTMNEGAARLKHIFSPSSDLHKELFYFIIWSGNHPYQCLFHASGLSFKRKKERKSPMLQIGIWLLWVAFVFWYPILGSSCCLSLFLFIIMVLQIAFNWEGRRKIESDGVSSCPQHIL